MFMHQYYQLLTHIYPGLSSRSINNNDHQRGCAWLEFNVYCRPLCMWLNCFLWLLRLFDFFVFIKSV